MVDPVHPPDQIPIFDFDRLREMCGMDADFERDLLEEYLTETPGLLDRMQTALEERDFPQLHLQAHSLKGSSQVLGAERLGWYCQELETAAERAHAEPAPGFLQSICEEYGAVRELLRQHLGLAA